MNKTDFLTALEKQLKKLKKLTAAAISIITVK